MIDNLLWPKTAQVALDLRHRLEDRGLNVAFVEKKRPAAKAIKAPLLEIRDEIEEGDVEYCAPLLVKRVCEFVRSDPAALIEIGPISLASHEITTSVYSHSQERAS